MAPVRTRLTRGEVVVVAMVIASASIWPFMDAIAGHLGETGVPATQIAWGRYVGNGVLLLPLVLARGGRRLLLPRRELLHLARAVIPSAIAVAFFVGLRFLPFASASAPALHHRLLVRLPRRAGGALRWAAVAMGFVGRSSCSAPAPTCSAPAPTCSAPARSCRSWPRSGSRPWRDEPEARGTTLRPGEQFRVVIVGAYPHCSGCSAARTRSWRGLACGSLR